ncbi:MAG TPA: PorP/SprF family type IX secretion system membrane protein [Chitinophagaceae bacterium]|jgi:type IX secretion system PorP/SprF family membrane protein|nr:PorP/SprF family type IX secretion system membrane protein [Chitinophagaceae bacterium]
MRRLFLMLIVMYAGNCIAQDPHFSQFYSSPLTLNPAFTGKFDGNFRFAANYRNQWPSIDHAYETGTASVDFPILRNKISYRDILGIGLMAYTDKSSNGAVSYNYFSASAAFHKGLDEDGYSQLGMGFQATYSNMLINTSKLFFEDQLTPTGFDPFKPTGETFNTSTLSSHYVDLNAGLLYTTSTSDRDNYYAGISVYHITRPKQSFTGALYLLDPRATFHAGGYFPVGETTTLHFSGLYSTQANAHETVLGGAMEFALSPDEDHPLNFYAGAWMRFGDALIPYVGLEYNQFRLGTTYDVNTSSLKTASQSRGGIELSLIYIAKPAGAKGLPCPKF